MNVKSMRIAVLFLAVAVFASCAGGPKPAPEPDPTGAKVYPEALTLARTAADDSRAKALSIKADVAAKDSFTRGETGYTAGTELTEADDYESATAQFTTASSLYEQAYQEALQKKEAALKAMKTAEEDRLASEQVLQAAEDQAAGDTK